MKNPYGLIVKNKELFFDGVSVEKTSKQFKTPFFLFSENILERNYSNIQTAFAKDYENFRIYYSIKTNHELSVLKKLANMGCGGEISCAHELYIALKAGINPQKICFDGPSKVRDDIEYAIREGVHIFNCESWDEAVELNEIAKSMRKKINIGFRIDPNMDKIRSSWVEVFIHKFGITEDEAINIYRKAKKLNNLNIMGIHAHIGSQNTSTYPYISAIKAFGRISRTLKKYGIELKEFNVGGGFPSPSLNKSSLLSIFFKFLNIKILNKAPSIEVFAKTITEEFKKEIIYSGTHPLLAIEPGRSIMSSMGILVSRVKRVKNNWIFLDATMKSIPESLFFAERELVPAMQINDEKMTYNVSGASLSTSDIFFLKKKLPRIKKDDVMAVLDAGAYSISMAVPFTVANPPVYMILKKGGIKLVRRPSLPRDIIAPMYS